MIRLIWGIWDRVLTPGDDTGAIMQGPQQTRGTEPQTPFWAIPIAQLALQLRTSERRLT